MAQEQPTFCLAWSHRWLFDQDWLCMPQSDWASWVQAIGSIAAIVAAGLFIRWQVVREGRQQRDLLSEQGRQQRELLAEQHAEQERLRKEDEIRRLQIVASGFFHCRTMLESIRHSARRSVSYSAEIEQLARHVDALYAIPMLDIPSPRVTYAIVSARSAVETLRHALERVDLAQGRGVRLVEERVNVALSYLESHEATVVSCLEERGAQPYHLTYSLSDGTQETLRVLSHGHPEHFGLMASDYAQSQPPR